MASHDFQLALTILFITLAVLGCAYSALSAWLIVPFFKRETSVPQDYPPISVIRPLRGDEYALRDNLTSFFHQAYPGPVQYIFGVHDASDGALATVDALRQRYPDIDITVIVDARLHGPNRKISNLLNMLPHAKHEVIVFADSDVAVPPDHLHKVVGTLQDPDVGLVSCLYYGNADPGLWPRISAAASDYHFAPSVVVGLTLQLARPCFGPTIAMRRATLERIGGLDPFACHLAEDHAIGEAVRKTGLSVVIPSYFVSHACVEKTFDEFVSHKLRASRTVRRITPAGHLGSVLTHPFALAALACLVSHGTPWTYGLLAFSLATRLFVGARANRALGQSARGLWLLPLCDILMFGVFIASFRSSLVVWRGHRFDVDQSGLMTARK